MSALIFTLTAANIGIYFAFVSVIKAFGQILPGAFALMVLGPGACACGYLASRKRKALRFLFVLLPPLSLLFAQDYHQAILLIPAAVYPLLILISGRFSAEYWAYRNHFLWSSVALFLLMIISQTGKAGPWPVIFGIISLILGTFTLRQIRFGQITGPKQKALELCSLAVIPAGMWLAVTLAVKSRSAAGWLTERVFYPLGMLMQNVAGFFDSLISPVEDQRPAVEESSAVFESESAAMNPEQSASELPPAGMSNGDIIRWILILLAAAAALWLIISLIRRLKETQPRETLGERVDLETESDRDSAGAAAQAQHNSNRRKIRRMYEKYLKLLSRRSFVRKPQDSSQDILEKTRGISVLQPAQELRQLYILARYDPNAVITDAQVREVRRLLRKLREEPKKST